MFRTLLLLGSLWFTASLWAQTGPRITLSVSNEQVSLPMTRFAPFHPGLELTYTAAAVETSYGSRGWQASAGGYFHGFPTQGAYLRGAYQWQWQPIPQLGLSVAPGIGYLHTWTAQPVYWPNEAGVYEEVNNWGRPEVMAEVGFGIALWPQNRLSPTLGYRFAVEAPFSTVIPFLPRNFYQIGLTYQLPSS